MPSNIPATTIRIDPEVKREAAAILDELGLSMSTAVNAFLRAPVREGGMPFEMRGLIGQNVCPDRTSVSIH